MLESILVRNVRDPLAGLTRAEFEGRLRGALAGRVDMAWLFGSYVRGGFGADSDVDLILVLPTSASFPERSGEFADLLDLGPRLDILVYTPEEFGALLADPSPGFWRGVAASLRALSITPRQP